MQKPDLLLLFVLFSILGASCFRNVNTNVSKSELETTFQLLLDEAVYASHESVPGVSMTVISPNIEIEWSGSSGYSDKNAEQELSADQPFRIASITKTFVAASILRLHEERKLSIDEPISKYISANHTQMLKDGGYEPNKMTIRQTLNHTSGLYDYAVGGVSYLETIKSNPGRRWTRTEQIELAMNTGDPIGHSGEKYRYSDTGYVLAGETIESAADTSLAYGLRSLLGFEELKLTSTWLETLEEAPLNHPPLVRRFIQRIDATAWDASIDLYGGGGLVSTTKDLATFMHALFKGKVFNKSETLSLMLSSTAFKADYDFEKDPYYEDYRLGLFNITLFGYEAFMHTGIWDSLLLHIPENNTTISINFTDGYSERLLKKTVLAIKNAIEKEN